MFVFLRLKNKSIKELGQVSNSPFEVLEIQVPKNIEDNKDALMPSMAAETMFAALHGLLREDSSQQEHFSFEVCDDGTSGIKFYVAVPQSIVKFVESQLYGQ